MQGKILKVKHGYNPNSSSMGSIIFVLPVSMIAASFGMAAVSGLIFSHFIKDAGPTDAHDADERPEREGDRSNRSSAP
jgi:hypothetical protein